MSSQDSENYPSEYWLYEAETAKNNINYINDRVNNFEDEKQIYSVILSEEICSKLNTKYKNDYFMLFTFFAAVLKISISKYSSKDDVTLGIPAYKVNSGRNRVYNKIIPLTCSLDYDISFNQFSAMVSEKVTEAYKRQDELNINLLAENGICDDIMEITPISISMKDFHNEKHINYINNSSKNQISFLLHCLQDNFIKVEVVYNSRFVSKNTIQTIIKIYEQVIQGALENENCEINDLGIITKEEKADIVHRFNDTKTDYPKNKTIQELFEEQVEKNPDNIAVVLDGKYLTYRQLNEKANELALILRSKYVQRDSIVPIMVEKSLQTIIGVIGILKAGGAYMPIDPSYPNHRIEHMVRESKSNVIVTFEKCTRLFPNGLEVLNLDSLDLKGVQNNPDLINKQTDLAYVIYTSGTTGTPKGIMCEHKNVVRLVKNTNYIELNSSDRILQSGSIVFDASTFEIWGALLNGLQLHLAGNEIIISPDKLEKYIDNNNITIMWLTSELFSQVAQLNSKVFKKLRYLLIGGDVLSTKYVNSVRREWKNLNIINGYGPTENTTFSTTFRIEQEYISSIPIGKPIANSKVYIVDRTFCNLMPVGVYGEICVAGEGLARGYLNNPELTAEKFIDNPFDNGEKMYKTGDVGRWLPDGNIEFLGRKDNQVKIRGFRIELGELENALLKHEGIREAVVLTKENSLKEKYLCAYLVSEKNLEAADIKNYLKDILPDYMIPTHFVQLEKMPVTLNGKIDRAALPEPSINDILSSYEEPNDELQKKLVSIWREVLHKDKIGINDNFFDLGGHSLRATALIAQIHNELNVEIPLKELFKSPTIKGISKFIKNTEENICVKVEKVGEKEFYKVSSAQKRMYMMQQLDRDTIAYNMPTVFELIGEIDRGRIEKAFGKLVERHESLRTYFYIVDNEIVQKIVEPFEFNLDIKVEKENIESIFNKLISPFNLEEAPLFRVQLIEAKGKYYLFIDMHHIISDGISMSILMDEFSSFYNARGVQELYFQYKDFAEWQNKYLKSDEMRKQEEYWIGKLNDEIPILNLPYDFERNKRQSFEGECVSLLLDKETSNKIRILAKETNCTVHMVLLSVFTILLSKYSEQEDIIIGIPVSGREKMDFLNVIGMFVNSLAIRNNPKGQKVFIEFLEEVKENLLQAYENQNYQFDELVEKLGIKRDYSRNPLFNVMFNMIDMLDASEIELEGVTLKQIKTKHSISKLDLTLIATDTAEELKFDLEYSTNLFKRETVNRILEHYINVLKIVIKDKNISLSNITMISETEKSTLLNEFNDTCSAFPAEKTIHQMFEEQVEKTPDEVAVIFEDKKLTYRELNHQSNSLARALRDKGINSDSIVGIMVERSLNMIIGIMAVLKSGGAYLPIDPEYPDERISYMLEDSKSTLVLTEDKFVSRLSSEYEIINISNESLYSSLDINLEGISRGNNLAYVIYTSGTTGRPKGVMIEHRQINNFINGINKKIMLDVYRNILCITSISFDIFVLETLLPLTCGMSITITPTNSFIDGQKIGELIQKNKIEIMQSTPSRIKLLMQSAKFRKSLETLQVLLIGGDYVPVELLNELNGYKNLKVYNMYGPTETTVWSTIKAVTAEDKVGIGQPIQNTKILILNNNMNLQPIGVPGELFIGGQGVARGYINNIELTKEKFVGNPYNLGERIYRTGDLARWLPNGNIDFLGRIDNQVKIRGFRIELEEIETNLLNLADIKEALVVDKEINGIKQLCAYYTGSNEYTAGELREILRKRLPEYMIPSFFVKIEKIPLSSNGKVDRKLLPEPKRYISIGSDYLEPRNQIEKNLLLIWKEILKIEHIGINDNFFEIGGNSFNVIQISNKLNEVFNKEIPLLSIFRYPTISLLAKFIESDELKDEQITTSKECFEKIDKGRNRLRYRAEKMKEHAVEESK